MARVQPTKRHIRWFLIIPAVWILLAVVMTRGWSVSHEEHMAIAAPPPPPIPFTVVEVPTALSRNTLVHAIVMRTTIAPNPSFAILARPSVSVEVIDSELHQYNSPLLAASWAGGKSAARYIWDAGRVLGIDPAVLMAIFRHESHYGTRGMARLTDSVGNLRPLAGQPQLDGYRFYRAWEDAVDDTYRLLGDYARRGAPTVAIALPVWAPSADGNDVNAYVSDVEQTMDHYFRASS